MSKVKYVKPVRINRNRVFLLGYGMLTVPSGISVFAHPKAGRPYIMAKGLEKNVYKMFYVEHYATAEEWIDCMESAIDWLEETRGRLLIGHPLRRKVENGPIPGKGQPGIYYIKGRSDIAIWDPLNREIDFANSLPAAISLRLSFEHEFYQARAFNRSDMIPD